MINSIDLLDFVGLCRGTGDESGARGHVLKRDWVVLGMNFCFHNWFGLPPRYRRGGAGKMQYFEDVSSRYLICLGKIYLATTINITTIFGLFGDVITLTFSLLRMAYAGAITISESFCLLKRDIFQWIKELE